MKSERWMTALQASGMGFLISFGSISAFVTGFDLPLQDPWVMWVVCAGVSVLCAAVLSLKHGISWLLVLLSLGVWYLQTQPEASKQVLMLVSRISYLYDRAYHLGWLEVSAGAWDAGFADWPVCIWGSITAVTAVLCVRRGWSALIPGGMAALPLSLCFVMTDTPPALWSVLCLAWGIGVMAFSSRVRREDPGQGNRLALLMALPLAGALGLLVLAVPRESYVNQSREVRSQLAAWIEAHWEDWNGVDLKDAKELLINLTVPAQDPAQVDLGGMDGITQFTGTVMYVQADVGGTLYLRGRDYDRYDGTIWQSTPDRSEVFSSQGEALGTVTIQTVGALEQRYLPYYPSGQEVLSGGQVKNQEGYTSYCVTRTGLSGELYDLLKEAAEPDREPQQQYLSLPEGSRERLRQIGEALIQGADSATAKAERIGNYVRSSATYDKQTQRMDTGAEDFALWFLEQSDRGYCVHFATAAVALLRSVGVEARYVSGYMLRVQPGERTAVTGENAHAWAEYYEPRLGQWLPLEATPSSGAADGNLPVQQEMTRPQSIQPDTPEQQPKPGIPEGETERKPEPDAENPKQTQAKSIPRWVLESGKVLLILAALAAFAEGQRQVRQYIRRMHRCQGSCNDQALARWRETERLAWLLKEKPPEALRELAQKAKFSQHSLTQEELAAFDSVLCRMRGRLSREPWIKRMAFRYLFAVL